MHIKSDRRIFLEMKPWLRFLMVARLALLLSCSACVIAVVTGEQPDIVEAATVLFEGRNFEKAESLLRQALETSPSDTRALVLLGRVRATVGHVEEAEGLYRNALEASPLDAPAHHALAKLLTFQHRWGEAKESYERSLELHEENAEAWLGMGRVAMATEDEDAAARYYNRSLELDPTSALLLFDIGVLNCKKGKVAAAEEAFSKSAELNPTLDWKVVAQIFAGFDMLSSARNAYKKVILKDPDPADQLAYGELSETVGDNDEAMKAYDLALLSRPGMGKAHLRKALLLTGTGLTNLAAVHAFGLNKAQAKWHFQSAVSSGEQDVVGIATEALAFCDMEEREVEIWRRRVATLPSDQNTTAIPKSLISQSLKESEESSTTPPWVESQGGYLQMPNVYVGGAEDFMGELVNRSRPAVVKNFQSGFAPKEAWSWAALSDRFGNSVVRVSLSETGRFDGPEAGELWGLPSGEEVLVRPPGTSMSFSDFVRLLRTDGLNETFYLEYLAVHQYLGQPLRDMIPLPEAVRNSGLQLLLTNLWIGKGGTTAVLHYDDYENLLCQIRGTKELVLFPPSDLENLYYIGRRKGKLKYDFPGKWTRDGLDGSNKVFFSSSVHVDNPDFTGHPRIKRCRPYRVTLREGDVLYLPAYWHHEVRSHPDEDEGNIAVNFWFRNVTNFAEEEYALGGGGGSSADGSRQAEL